MERFINKTLKPINREQANLEAEKGETVVTNLQGEGIPEFFRIGGKLHSQGGTPLNLPDNSFFFSRNKELQIKDRNILDEFDMKVKKSGYTPAEISKKYDLNKYREILLDPDSSKLERHTAELMIMNCIEKLGELAIAQESMKGFDNGIPFIAMPFLEKNNIDPNQFLQDGQEDIKIGQFKYGGEKSERKLKKYVEGGNTYKFSQIPQDRTKYPVFNSEEEYLKNISLLSEDAQPFIKIGENQYKPYKAVKQFVTEYKPGDVNETFGEIQQIKIGDADKTTEFYNFANYLMKDNYAKAKEIYENWKLQEFKTKIKDENGNTVESKANVDRDFFKKLYEENTDKYKSEEEAFAKYFLVGQLTRNQYRNEHSDDWADWSNPDSDISKQNSGSGKIYLNSNAHTKQFMQETGMTEDDIKLFQSMDLALNDYAKNGNGKNDGIFSYSTNKADPNSDAGVDATIGSKNDDMDLSSVDAMAGERFTDNAFQINNPEYVVEESDWTPEEQQPIEYKEADKGVRRGIIPDIPSWMQAMEGLRERYSIPIFGPFEAPEQRIEMNPEYVNNFADISNMLSMAATAANSQGLSADPNKKSVAAAMQANAIAPNMFKSDQDTYNKNIDIKNAFEQAQASLDSDYNKRITDRMTKLHDNWMRTRQDFENTKNARIKNAVDLTVNHLRKSVDNFNRSTENLAFGPYGEIIYTGDRRKLAAEASRNASKSIESITDELMKKGMSAKDAHDQAIKQYKVASGISDGTDLESLLRATGVSVG